MKFSADSDDLTWVRWYFVPNYPQSSPLPFPTRFGSGNWASEKAGWEGLGEVLNSPRLWVNGSPPASLPPCCHPPASVPCGDAEDFLTGINRSQWLPGIPNGKVDCIPFGAAPNGLPGVLYARIRNVEDFGLPLCTGLLPLDAKPLFFDGQGWVSQPWTVAGRSFVWEFGCPTVPNHDWELILQEVGGAALGKLDDRQFNRYTPLNVPFVDFPFGLGSQGANLCNGTAEVLISEFGVW